LESGGSGRSGGSPYRHHLKCIVQDGYVSRLFLWLVNTCLQSGHWPAEFKASAMVVILKPGKPSYDTPKLFHPIVLLNTLGKVFEKMLSNRQQLEAAKHRVCKGNPHFCHRYRFLTIPAPSTAGSHARRRRCSRLSRGPETSISDPYLSSLVVECTYTPDPTHYYIT
jgi:hypothetical protein